MICVFGAFVLGDVRVLRVFGLGMAAAILLDATLVRMVLMPSALHLLGEKGWWIPRWLDSLLPNSPAGPEGTGSPFEPLDGIRSNGAQPGVIQGMSAR
jgi:RND superfamily putative drug exporter